MSKESKKTFVKDDILKSKLNKRYKGLCDEFK